MKVDDLEGSLVLEKLASLDLLDDFFEAIDSDNIQQVLFLLKKARIDQSMIEMIMKKINESNS